MKTRRVFGFFQNFIPYYRELRSLTKSALATIIAPRIEYWFEKYPEGFYKFLEPAPNHPKYQNGQSWCEETGLNKDEFNRAFNEIGVTFTGKNGAKPDRDSFRKISLVQRYKTEIKNKNGKKTTIRKKDGEPVEIIEQVYYCRIYMPRLNLTYYFKNPEKSLLDDALKLLQSSEDELDENQENGKSDLQYHNFRENGKSDLRKTDNPGVGDRKLGQSEIGKSMGEYNVSKDNSIDNPTELKNKIKEPLLAEKKPKIDQKHFDLAIDCVCALININRKLSTNRKRAGAFVKQIVEAGYDMIKDLPYFMKVIYAGDRDNQYPFAWRFGEQHWVGQKGGKLTEKILYETWGQWFNGKCARAEELFHLKLKEEEIQIMSAAYGYQIVKDTLDGMDTEEMIESMNAAGGGRSHYEIVKDNVIRIHEEAAARQREREGRF